jgi:uncharacterized glyoxalase superfamily protein PhnB
MPILIDSATPLFAVYDVPAALAFYRDLLGFEVVSSSVPFTDAKDDFGWALLRLNGVDLMLNNAYEDNIRPARPVASRIAAHADTILYFACPDVDAAYEYLVSRGVAVQPPAVAYYNMKQLYLTDPDGYILCFQWPVAFQ